MSSNKDDSKDIFIASHSYPDADGVFYNDYQTLDQIRDHCLVILDTNALLVPYGISKSSLSQIEATYKSLAAANRLVIPGQVAREFVKNRPVKIGEIFQALSRKKSISSFRKGRYPLLEEVPEYSKFQELEKQIDDLLYEYKKAIGDLINHVQGWNWNDPVSRLYSEIFPPLVVDIALDSEDDKSKVRSQLKYQNTNKLPPGYKDSSKDDEGIGDYLIWQVVLKVAKERKCPIVFVSGDSKADWFYRSEKQPLFPRFELVDQIRRATDGKSFHIVQFSDFLELFGATAAAVGEVRKEEIKVDLSNMSRHGRAVLTGHLAEEAVANWLRETYPFTDVERDEKYGDYCWSERGGASILVEVRNFRESSSFGQVLRSIKARYDRFEAAYESGNYDNILFCIVSESPEFVDTVALRLPELVHRFGDTQGIVVAELSKTRLVRVLDPLNMLPEFG